MYAISLKTVDNLDTVNATALACPLRNKPPAVFENRISENHCFLLPSPELAALPSFQVVVEPLDEETQSARRVCGRSSPNEGSHFLALNQRHELLSLTTCQVSLVRRCQSVSAQGVEVACPQGSVCRAGG